MLSLSAPQSFLNLYNYLCALVAFLVVLNDREYKDSSIGQFSSVTNFDAVCIKEAYVNMKSILVAIYRASIAYLWWTKGYSHFDETANGLNQELCCFVWMG